MDEQKLVHDLVRRAGVVEPPPVGAGTFAGESLLVLRGGGRSTLDIYDRHGRQIGTAKRTSGRNSRNHRYELLDPRPGLIVTDVSKSRWAVGDEFTIEGADGSPIASAYRWMAMGGLVPDEWPIADAERWIDGPLGPQRDDRPNSYSDSVVFLRDGEPIAGLWKMSSEELRRTRPRDSGSSRLRKFLDRFADDNLFYVDDQSGRLAARITRLSAGYVIELQAGTSEPLSTIAVAACIANYGFVSESGGGGGGAA